MNYLIQYKSSVYCVCNVDRKATLGKVSSCSSYYAVDGTSSSQEERTVSGYLSWQISNDNSFCYRVSIRRISGFPLALQIAGCHKFFLCIGDHNARFPLHDLFLLLHLLKIFHYLKFSVILIFGWSAHIQKLLTHKNFQLQYM